MTHPRAQARSNPNQERFTVIDRTTRLSLLALGAMMLPAAPLSASALDATATYTATPAGASGSQYHLTLKNTGTTTIGTFWFAWIPGGNFLSVAPTNVVAPAGWTANIINAGGYSVQYLATSAASYLQPGSSLTGFAFDSTETPAQLLGTVPAGSPGAGLPITTSFAYIGAPFSDPGLQFTATAASPPAPSSASPNSGSGSTQSFTLTYADSDGVSDLSSVYVLFNSWLNPAS